MTAMSTDSSDPVSTLDDLPLVLTITEAAKVLRISRSSAYKLAEEWRACHGASGLPTIRLGSRILVRRVDLAALLVSAAAGGDLD
jgi:excisionase family DNA binding protein